MRRNPTGPAEPSHLIPLDTVLRRAIAPTPERRLVRLSEV
jgi:hypothetical protein